MAILSGLMVLAGVGAVCLMTILGASLLVSGALLFVLLGALAGALFGAVRRMPLPQVGPHVGPGGGQQVSL